MPRILPEITTIQARILVAALPEEGRDRPLLTRAKLGERAGFTPLSGCPTRALNGLREGSSSGKAHPGLLALGCLERFEIDVDGVEELAYQITDLGEAVAREWIEEKGLPKMRGRDISTNWRYKG